MPFNQRQVESQVNKFNTKYDEALKEYTILNSNMYPIPELKYFRCDKAKQINDIKKKIVNYILTYDYAWLYLKITPSEYPIYKDPDNDKTITLRLDYNHPTYNDSDLIFELHYKIIGISNHVIRDEVITQNGNRVFSIPIPNHPDVYNGKLVAYIKAIDNIGQSSPYAYIEIPILSTDTSIELIHIDLINYEINVLGESYLKYEVYGDIIGLPTIEIEKVSLYPYMSHSYDIQRVNDNRVIVTIHINDVYKYSPFIYIYFIIKTSNNTLNIVKSQDLDLLDYYRINYYAFDYINILTNDSVVLGHNGYTYLIYDGEITKYPSDNLIAVLDNDIKLYNIDNDKILITNGYNSELLNLSDSLAKWKSNYNISYLIDNDKLILAIKIGDYTFDVFILTLTSFGVLKQYNINLEDMPNTCAINIAKYDDKYYLSCFSYVYTKSCIVVFDNDDYQLRYKQGMIIDIKSQLAIKYTGTVYKYIPTLDKLNEISNISMPNVNALLYLFFVTENSTNIIYQDTNGYVHSLVYDITEDKIVKHIVTTNNNYIFLKHSVDKVQHIFGITNTQGLTHVLTYKQYKGPVDSFNIQL